jgi:hypothetical protein
MKHQNCKYSPGKKGRGRSPSFGWDQHEDTRSVTSPVTATDDSLFEKATPMIPLRAVERNTLSQKRNPSVLTSNHVSPSSRKESLAGTSSRDPHPHTSLSSATLVVRTAKKISRRHQLPLTGSTDLSLPPSSFAPRTPSGSKLRQRSSRRGRSSREKESASTPLSEAGELIVSPKQAQPKKSKRRVVDVPSNPPPLSEEGKGYASDSSGDSGKQTGTGIS